MRKIELGIHGQPLDGLPRNYSWSGLCPGAPLPKVRELPALKALVVEAIRPNRQAEPQPGGGMKHGGDSNVDHAHIASLPAVAGALAIEALKLQGQQPSLSPSGAVDKVFEALFEEAR
jgi:hypothetical protein